VTKQLDALALPSEDSLLSTVDGLRPRDVDFLKRVYDTTLTTYRERFHHLGFLDMDRVLDAGCGFGQWTLALPPETEVVGVDTTPQRVRTASLIASHNEVPNGSFCTGDISALPFESDSFDGIFSYSVVYFADLEQVAEEWYRVLRPGGRAYLCTNGVGKYLHDIVHNPNPSADFSPRRFAVRTLLNTMRGRTEGLSMETGASAMRPSRVKQTLAAAGFEDIRLAGEGELSEQPDGDPHSFYDGKYLGLARVFEAMGTKPRDDQ
jgi:ubiquinone/menaquinone biosynthesis C-methylase UbiE